MASQTGGAIAPQEAIRKEPIEEGSGEPPGTGDQVTVHYTCRLESSGEVLDCSRERGEPLQFVVGDAEVISGLEQAVASLRPGGRAAFGVPACQAHGASACLGGEVPPGAALLLEVELLEVQRGGRNSFTADEAEAMSPEECLQAAMRAKDSGNVSFKAGDLQKAAASYDAGLRLLGVATGSGDDAESAEQRGEVDASARWGDAVRREARDQLALSCLLNIAQCELRLERYSEALQHASAAFTMDPQGSKAVYRRGLAAMGLGLLEAARADLALAARREPRNAEVRAKLEECKRRLQACERRDRSTFGGMFGRGSLSGGCDAVPP